VQVVIMTILIVAGAFGIVGLEKVSEVNFLKNIKL
jgi:hypothetical protein